MFIRKTELLSCRSWWDQPALEYDRYEANMGGATRYNREVGSIYTVQGFDLNNVGVVIGPSIDYDPETDQLVIDIDKYEDKGAFTDMTI